MKECEEVSMNYQQTFNLMEETRELFEDRIWHIIELAEDIDAECPYLEAAGRVLPDIHCSDWSISVQQARNGVMVFFTRTEAYEDWSEHEQVFFSWSELNYSDEEILSMWKARGKKLLENESRDAFRELSTLAGNLGYTVSKKEEVVKCE